MNYNKNMKLELFRMGEDGTKEELLETFTLDDVKEQYDETLNLHAKDLEREKKKNEAKSANKTEEEKAQDEISIKDRELAHFWGRRARDSSHWSMFLNTGNVLA